MAKDNKKNAGNNATATAPVKETTTTAAPATEVNVTEAPAAPVASVVPTAPAVPVVAKTRLFWQKSCHDLKQSTNTEIKEGEVFVKTPHTVMIQKEGEEAPVQVPVYSLKRGKRIYYTPYVTPEQAAVADQIAQAKAEEKAAKDKEKADKKAAAEAEKAAKAAIQPAAAVAAQPAATAAGNVTEMSEEDMEG